MKHALLAAGVTALILGLATPATAEPHPAEPARGTDGYGQATLTGFASLAAETFVPDSEPSGALLGANPINGLTLPFPNQPVQGFSGIVPRGGGVYDMLSDNGYGRKNNSADFLLRVHRVKADLSTGQGNVLGGFNLTDPNGHITFPLTREDRTLTGADIDVESILRAADGTYWMGDEFGPFLLHFSPTGELLSPPVPLPGVQAPENPLLNGAQPNLGSSKGFEGIARSVKGRHIYPLLEGTVTGDPAGTLRLYEYDLRKRTYTDKRWTYRLDAPRHSIGDAVAVDRHRFLIIERDGRQGDAAAVKKVYLADTRDRDADGLMDKTLVADLLNIANPHGLGGLGETFRFPFETIENLAILDNHTLIIANDNNLPFSSGRTPGKPDNNEFITIKLTRSLNADPRVIR
ncbi:esterase-like activity of phytase family protein [Sinosporangium siamense]|uniref:Glycerophosphoryl diester phosphodiesterase n=1 Tax=Sinosporangium siamense TaxID=1367973 RepID=A0A919RER1_9ACTN|nr:esterase-like activity of phytase family protein [Sinosporangium siamense]GII92273.1 glycerophosphoryl diester phosphodiesterase [Sinosporangium siamense]